MKGKTLQPNERDEHRVVGGERVRLVVAYGVQRRDNAQ
jgi:hypothetical protein